MDILKRLPLALLFLRLGVFIVLLVWTLDKLLIPTHAALIFQKYYFINDAASMMFLVGVVEMVLIIGFIIGFMKRWTYGIVLVMHTMSTLAIFGKYLDLSSLVYFASWPMLAACFALYYLRDADTLWVVDKPKSTA